MLSDLRICPEQILKRISPALWISLLFVLVGFPFLSLPGLHADASSELACFYPCSHPAFRIGRFGLAVPVMVLPYLGAGGDQRLECHGSKTGGFGAHFVCARSQRGPAVLAILVGLDAPGETGVRVPDRDGSVGDEGARGVISGAGDSPVGAWAWTMARMAGGQAWAKNVGRW